MVGDDGSDEAVSYAAMAARSSQVANWLRGLGVRRGDHVLLMLGNIVPLWEVMLAAIKLGAVVIPASTLLQPADLADRVARGNVRHVIAEVRSRPSSSPAIPGEWTRIVVPPALSRFYYGVLGNGARGTVTRNRSRRRPGSSRTGHPGG